MAVAVLSRASAAGAIDVVACSEAAPSAIGCDHPMLEVATSRQPVLRAVLPLLCRRALSLLQTLAALLT